MKCQVDNCQQPAAPVDFFDLFDLGQKLPAPLPVKRYCVFCAVEQSVGLAERKGKVVERVPAKRAW